MDNIDSRDVIGIRNAIVIDAKRKLDLLTNNAKARRFNQGELAIHFIRASG